MGSGDACQEKDAATLENAAAGSGSDVAALVNGAERWASGAGTPESDAGGGWESEAALWERRGKINI